MYGLRDVLVQQEQLLEYRRQAQSWRQARLLAQMRRPSYPRRPALAWLGRQMMHLGRRLEAQYGA